MSTPTNAEDIIVLEWWEAIRRRPRMYIGSTGLPGIVRIFRELLDAAHNAADTEVVLQDHTISIRIAATPPSIALEARSGRPFLLEACTRMPMPVDEPPTLALVEILDQSVNPAEFRRVSQVEPVLTIANALSSEFHVSSICAGVATTFSFARGRFIHEAKTTPSPGPDGLGLVFTPDPEIFGDERPLFHFIAETARDIACIRGRTITVLEPSRDARYVCKGA